MTSNPSPPPLTSHNLFDTVEDDDRITMDMDCTFERILPDFPATAVFCPVEGTKSEPAAEGDIGIVSSSTPKVSMLAIQNFQQLLRSYSAHYPHPQHYSQQQHFEPSNHYPHHYYYYPQQYASPSPPHSSSAAVSYLPSN